MHDGILTVKLGDRNSLLIVTKYRFVLSAEKRSVFFSGLLSRTRLPAIQKSTSTVTAAPLPMAQCGFYGVEMVINILDGCSLVRISFRVSAEPRWATEINTFTSDRYGSNNSLDISVVWQVDWNKILFTAALLHMRNVNDPSIGQ